MIEINNEIKQGILTAVISAAALAGSLYAGKALDYRDTFLPGTVINGEDASDRTVEEMENLLSRYQLDVSFRDGDSIRIDGSEFGFRYISDGSLDRLIERQNPLSWMYGLFRQTDYTVSEKKEYSEEALISILYAAPQLQKSNMIPPEDAYLDYTDGKFTVIPEVDGTTLDPDKAKEALLKAVAEEQETLDLNRIDGVYSAPEILRDDEKLLREAEQLNALAGGRIEYELPGGDSKVLDGPILKEWLEVDDDGSYYRDDDVWDERIDEFVRELADEVDTVYSEHPFTTHEGDEIMLPGRGYYGYRLDKKSEAEQLRAELDDNEQISREPVYWRTEAAAPDDNHGFGGDYVEVDLSLQHMWIYENGEAVFETDVVSGTNDGEHRTPAGAFFAYDKKTDTVLRGDKQEDGEWGYETPVDYWIRLTDTGIGMHDASWRYYFGGSIWQWNGSHGCINIPTWAMPVVYEKVYENMPVAVHYGATQ